MAGGGRERGRTHTHTHTHTHIGAFFSLLFEHYFELLFELYSFLRSEMCSPSPLLLSPVQFAPPVSLLHCPVYKGFYPKRRYHHSPGALPGTAAVFIQMLRTQQSTSFFLV